MTLLSGVMDARLVPWWIDQPGGWDALASVLAWLLWNRRSSLPFRLKALEKVALADHEEINDGFHLTLDSIKRERLGVTAALSPL
jgi:hypothetical protein